MKLALVLLILLPLVLAGTMEEKRLLVDVGHLVNQLKHLVTSSTGHAGCVTICHTIAGAFGFLCDLACTEVLHLVAG